MPRIALVASVDRPRARGGCAGIEATTVMRLSADPKAKGTLIVR